MSEIEDNFDWAGLPEAEWRALGKQVKVSEQMLRFAACKLRGMSDTESAAQSGYGGDRTVLKQQGHRTKKNGKVAALIALAKDRKAALVIEASETSDRVKWRRKLSRLTESGDPRVEMQAIEALRKMDREDKQDAASTDLPQPAEILKQIHELSPVTAAFLAAQTGMDIPGFDMGEVRKWVESAPAAIQGSPFLNHQRPEPRSGVESGKQSTTDGEDGWDDEQKLAG